VRGRGVADPGVEPHRPILPLLPTTPRRQSHDYARHGTTNLYAALNLASGLVVSQMTPRHRAVGFKRFLARIDQALPAELDVDVIVDNSSTHKTRPSGAGCWPIPASTCTSRPPTARG
jgi:hypothetical protein